MLAKLKTVTEKMFAPKLLSHLANFLDNRFTLPGTSYRVGWDFLIGLVPVVGDLVAAILSSYLIVAALYHRADGITIARMLMNMLLDFVIGLVPIIGDIFDAGWMANAKNVRLLLQDIEKQTAIHNRTLA